MLGVLFKGLKDLIYPNCCLVCKNRIQTDSKQDSACRACWDNIDLNLPPFCSSCGRHLDLKAIEKNTCASCLNAKFYFDRAFSPCIYTGNLKKLIHEFKYCGKDYLSKPLSMLMNEFIRDYGMPIEHLDFIVPIPLHKSRQREREFNQAQLLGQEIGKEFNKEVLADALIRSKQTKTQTELTKDERRKNVEKSFYVSSPAQIKDANLLLIDDVLTTAATANEASKSLKNAGAKKIILLTLAN